MILMIDFRVCWLKCYTKPFPNNELDLLDAIASVGLHMSVCPCFDEMMEFL